MALPLRLRAAPGRRTRKSCVTVCEEVPLFFWDGAEENPDFGLLALADAIVVTSDSVSMVSEACATGKPVHVFDFGYGRKKLRQFHKALMDDGITRRFADRIEFWPYDLPNETERVASIVRERLRQIHTVAV